ncbi:MAG: L(+)-tartrate dehydratase subunit beta [Firmicutes bacterium]|nr:L(+)-tartrate dehydratase subunit beta [Bacillota bacterium]
MKKVLHTPVTNEDLQDIKVGEVVYLTGRIATCRDVGHRRVIALGQDLPYSIAGEAIFHAGPIVEPTEQWYKMVAIGPTTSMRMERFAAEFIAATGVKVIVGKGGMGARTAAACREHKALHCVFPGGCAVVGATAVEEIEGVEWLDLGMPEAFWIMRVKELGPLIVSIDTHGNNLFETNKALYAERKEAVVKEIAEKVTYIK